MTKPLQRRSKRLELTPGIRTCLRMGCDMLGEFPGLEEDEVEKKLDELWKVFGKQVATDYIKEFPGERPDLWWKHDAPGAGRPIVRPKSGTTEDSVRFAKERKVADIAFLIRHKLLSRAEQSALEAAGTPVQLDPTDGLLGKETK
jgi:hypothetical protein